MEQPNNHEKPQECPGYYGTGRRETDKSRLPLVVLLLGVVLAANLITVALHIERNRSGEKAAAPGETETAPDVYPAFDSLRENADGESVSFGMELSALEEAERRYWDLPEGLIVRSVASESVAAKVGILQGDILLSVEGTEVKTVSDYFTAIDAVEDNTITIAVYRCGTHYVLDLIIPDDAQATHLAS